MRQDDGVVMELEAVDVRSMLMVMLVRAMQIMEGG
jgi:hypothetical protein